MAGAAANLEYPLVEMFADESNQRRLDAGVVVLLVSPVVRVGDVVVVYASSHRDSGGLIIALAADGCNAC